jgi:hypothetical protein
MITSCSMMPRDGNCAHARRTTSMATATSMLYQPAPPAGVPSLCLMSSTINAAVAADGRQDTCSMVTGSACRVLHQPELVL